MTKVYNLLKVILLSFILVSCTNEKLDPTIEPDSIGDIVPDKQARIYKPGTYVNFSKELTGELGYKYVVVFIDDYGKISGVHIDETYNRALFYEDELGASYALVGNSYRLINGNLDDVFIPEHSDLKSAKDLEVGVDDDKISKLKPLFVNDTKFNADDSYILDNGKSFKEQSILLGNRIVEDNTVYNIKLLNNSGGVYTSDIEGVSMDIGEYIKLVEEVLLYDAKYNKNIDTVLTEPEYGIYTPGTYYKASELVETSDNVHSFTYSLVNVDIYGKLSSLFIDKTISDVDNQIVPVTTMILSEVVNEYADYKLQIEDFSKQAKQNQNIGFLNNINLDLSEYDYILNGIEESLEEARMLDYQNGTYVYTDDSTYTYITILDKMIESINIVDSNLTEEEINILNQELYNEFVVNEVLQIDFDENLYKILNETYFKIAEKAISNLDEKNIIFTTQGYNFTNVISNGSFYSENEDYYLLLNVSNNEIVSIIYDTNDSKYSDFFANQDLSSVIDFIKLSEVSIINQTHIINTISENYEYYNKYSTNSIKELPIFNKYSVDIMNSFDELLRNSVSKSLDNRLVQDSKFISEIIQNEFNSALLVSGMENAPISLPTKTFLLDDDQRFDLSNEYDIDYTVSNDLVETSVLSSGYLDINVLYKDIPTTVVTFTVNIYLDGTNEKVYSEKINVPVYSITEASDILFGDSFILNDFKILGDNQIDLPYTTSDYTNYEQISYSSDKPEVFDNYGNAYVVENGIEEVEMSVYFDVNQNNNQELDELIYKFKVFVYSSEEALKETLNLSSLSLLPTVLNGDVLLNTQSNIYGINYKYSLFSTINDSAILTKTNPTTYSLEIIRSSVGKRLIVEVDIMDDNLTLEKQDFEFELKSIDSKTKEEYVNETIDALTVNVEDITSVGLGYNFGFNRILEDLKYLDEISKENIIISIDDPDNFVDMTTYKVVKVPESINSSISLNITVTYPNGGPRVTKVYDVTILSKDSIKEQINKDLYAFTNIYVDSRRHSSRGHEISLPRYGRNNLSSLTYLVDNNDYFSIVNHDTLHISPKIKNHTSDDDNVEMTITCRYAGFSDSITIKIIIA